MINTDIHNNKIIFENITFNLYNQYFLEIKQIIFLKEKMIIRGMPKRQNTPPCNYLDENFSRNNIFIFNFQGEILHNFGSRKEIDNFMSYPDYIEIRKDYLKLYYQSNYEVWYDIDSGKKIKEEYVYKK
ncbi:hypothetical protein [Mangrovimonas cancribranchiae]|uniref:Uncharacterized protein n=1 Tax=Mangrovimonas cancribranchiae TaxID=3080055 RepID=A0AAU6P3Z7_9FLAO